MTYKMNIAGVEHELPICPIGERLSIGGFVIFGHTKLCTACASALLEKAPAYDYILTAEAKGIPLAHEMARLHGDDYYIVARKKPKLYMTTVYECKVQSISTEGTQKLYLDGADAEKMKGKRILIVDDVISTGESLRALETLCANVGACIIGKMCILAEGEAQNRTDLIYLEKLPLFTPDGKPIDPED